MVEPVVSRPGWWRFFVSLRLSVSLLFLGALGMGVGCLVKYFFGDLVADRLVFDAIWFLLLQVFLVLNLSLVVIHRLPLRREQFGYVMAHLGFCLLLIGSWWSRSQGFDGVITLRGGESTAIAQVEGLQVVLGAPLTQMDLEPQTFAVASTVGKLPQVLRLEDADGPGLTLEAMVDHGRLIQDLVEGGAQDPPGIHLEVTKVDGSEGEMFLLASASAAPHSLEGISIVLRPMASGPWAATHADPVEAGLLRNPGSVVEPMNLLEFYVGPQAALHAQIFDRQGVALAVEIGEGRELEFPEFGLRIRLQRFYKHARREFRMRAVAVEEEGETLVRLGISRFGHVQPVWLRQDGRATVGLPQGHRVLSFGPRTRSLPFTVLLESVEFRPWSTQDSRPEGIANLRFTPLDQRAPQMRGSVSFGRPFDNAGYRIALDREAPGPEWTSSATLLHVDYHPGNGLIYASFVFLVLGAIWTLLLFRNKGSRKSPLRLA